MAKFLDNKTPEELFVGQLTLVINDLTAKKKSLENIVEELRSQMTLIERDFEQRRVILQREHDALVKQLQIEVEPLQAQKAQVLRLQEEILTLKRDALDAAQHIKTTKGLELQKANAALTEAGNRLAQIVSETNAYKTRVANL